MLRKINLNVGPSNATSSFKIRVVVVSFKELLKPGEQASLLSFNLLQIAGKNRLCPRMFSKCRIENIDDTWKKVGQWPS
jgi:hypothetical protein